LSFARSSPKPASATPSTPSPPDDLPYLTHIPRLSYLPLLLPRLSAFFGRQLTSFTYEGIELRNLPAGLLVDLYSPELPWRVEVGEGWGGGLGAPGVTRAVEDGWVNSVKEVC